MSRKNKNSITPPRVETREIIVTEKFVSETAYNQLLEENRHLKQQVSILEGNANVLREQLDEKIRTIELLQQENAILRAQVDELNDRVKQLEDSNQHRELVQKFSDTFDQVKDSLHTLLFNDETVKKSGDTSLYYLGRHLKEYNEHHYARRSVVKNNLEIWQSIYDRVLHIISEEYGMVDIGCFLEILRLCEDRNGLSHATEAITLDELQTLSPRYFSMLWHCLEIETSQ
jgi:regulator of replication initiation timing